MNKFIYYIQDLIPPEKGGLGMWGFRAGLDCESALKARTAKRTLRFEKILQEDARGIIAKFGLAQDTINPYKFVENSMLLQIVNVLGNSCDIALDESSKRYLIEEYKGNLKPMGHVKVNKRNSPIIYTPHNVDERNQAYALCSLWLHWANTVKDILADLTPTLP